MVRSIVLLLVGGIAIGSLLFFEHLTLVWLTFIGSLAKVSIMSVFVVVLKRIVFFEAPKLFLKLLYRVGVPIRARAKVRLFVILLRHQAHDRGERIVRFVRTLVGNRIAIVLGIMVTIAIGIIGFSWFGVYVLWLVTPARLFGAFSQLARLLTQVAWKFAAGLGLLQIWHRLLDLLPRRYRRRLWRFLRKVVRRRKQVTRRLEAWIEERKKLER